MSLYIHHYTNIEALALILMNRTLRFTRLDKVDDPEESNFVSNGVNLGPYTFVSCWTESKEESIPMWKMYTKEQWGVRLSMVRDGLFKTYTVENGFRVNGLVATSLGIPIKMLFPADVRFNQTDYTPPFLTDDYDKCNFYRKITYVDDLKPYTNDSFQVIPQSGGNVSVCIKSDKVGSYKNKRWSFQDESRFVLFFMPGNSFATFNTPRFDREQSRMINDIMHNKGLGFSYYDMCLNDDAFEHLVITMSPLCTDAQRSIVLALRDKYAPHAKIEESKLSGKLT